jgi:hypothetical protein
MAAEDQGIMSLPMQGQEAAQPMPQMPLEESYDAVSQGLQDAAPQASADIQRHSAISLSWGEGGGITKRGVCVCVSLFLS